MKAIVAVASKHGSTREIAEDIADVLARDGMPTAVADVSTIDNLDRYDIVVLGSAVYMGRLMPEMRRFVADHMAALRAKSVWMFASGPVGAPARPDGEVPELTALAGVLGAIGARTFAGRLKAEELGFKERLAVRMFRAEPGDFRDWDRIRTWAGEIVANARVPARS